MLEYERSLGREAPISSMLDGRGPDMVTCWTIQHRDVWLTLQRGQTYQVDSSRIEADLKQAYDWLCRETVVFLPGATGCYPVWAYARISRADFRILAASANNAEEFLLTCNISRQRVVLSDYEAWHHVLGGWLLNPEYDSGAITTAAECWWDRAEAALGAAAFKQALRSRQWPQPYQDELELSWRRIFDVKASVLRHPGTVVQATFEELRPSDVVRAVPLSKPGTSPARRLANLIRYL
jgi:hypothetical protein